MMKQAFWQNMFGIKCVLTGTDANVIPKKNTKIFKDADPMR